MPIVAILSSCDVITSGAISQKFKNFNKFIEPQKLFATVRKRKPSFKFSPLLRDPLFVVWCKIIHSINIKYNKSMHINCITVIEEKETWVRHAGIICSPNTSSRKFSLAISPYQSPTSSSCSLVSRIRRKEERVTTIPLPPFLSDYSGRSR